MTKIKRLAPKTCPDCGSGGSLFIDDDRVLTCRLCGYKETRNDEASTKQEEPDIDPRTKLRITYGTPNTREEIDRWAGIKYSSGLDYARQQNWSAAIESFEDAIFQQPEFVDAHLWIARLTLDPDKKRNHYGEVLAVQPKNLEAKRELMVLNGELSREEADRVSDMSREQDVQIADYAVGTKLVEIVCSNCGGTLEVPADSHQVTCQFCGHIEALKKSQGLGMQSLTMAMIKERAQGTKWRVGQHLLHCDNCGAERVITSKKMTAQCPFCASNHVIKTDALQSFRQPEGIVPFQINPQEAQEALDSSLNSISEKLKGIFVKNKAESISLTPVYLPFWMFDISADVTVSKTPKSGNRLLDEFASTEPIRSTMPDTLLNVPYCGVSSPSHRLTNRLEKFNLFTVKAYDPKLLAGATAELYSIDYQQASLDVRKTIGEEFRYRHDLDISGDYKIQVSYMIQGMEFRLLMLPVWIATIIEEDKDVRLALIHGQTGQAVLGKAVKAKS